MFNLGPMSILTEVKGNPATTAVIDHALYAYFFCRLTFAKIALIFGRSVWSRPRTRQKSGSGSPMTVG